MRTLFLIFFALFFSPATAEAGPRPYCPGGDVAEHARIAETTSHRLAGTYASACTMFVYHGCVYPDDRRGYPRTLLKFHSAMPSISVGDGKFKIAPGEVPGMHQPGNHTMLGYYPVALQQYLLRNRCLNTTQFKCQLTGSELIRLGVPACRG